MNLKRRWAHPTLALLTLGEHTSSVGAAPGTAGTDHGMVGAGVTMEHFLALLGAQLTSHQHSPPDTPRSTSPRRRSQNRRTSWGMGRGSMDISWGWSGVGTPPGFPSLPTHSPGIEDIFRMPCAAVVGDVAVLTVKGGWIGQARGQEVGPQLTCGHLGDTGQGEAGQAAKYEGAQLLVDHGHVSAAHEGWRAQLQAPDPNQLSQADLWGRSGWVKGVTAEVRGCKEGGKSSMLCRIWKGGCCFPLNQPKVWVFSFHHTHTHKWVTSPTPCV